MSFEFGHVVVGELPVQYSPVTPEGVASVRKLKEGRTGKGIPISLGFETRLRPADPDR